VFSNYTYVNLEDLDIRQMALDDPRGFLKLFTAPLIIDEAQYAPVLFSYLQSIVDKNRLPGSYILSGSQNFQMKRDITQSLAGRVGVLTLLPFSLPEMRTTNSEPKTLDCWLFTGSYPEVIASGINT
jgi:predicted AAA+ superfamily ATPase